MGRTSPPIRVALDKEAERLRRGLAVVRDPPLRRALEDILSSYNELIPFLALSSPQLPIDSILLSALVKLWNRVNELERKVALEGNPRQEPHSGRLGR